MNPWFSPDYVTARERFRRAARSLGWTLEAHPISAVGPDGNELTVDSACSPGDNSLNALVISSGLHGVEGFFGSAVQTALLEEWATGSRPDPSTKCVFLHAMNPFGFAWIRRVDENNVDLNRNFLLPGEAYAGAPAGYAELDLLLNPKRPPSPYEPFTLKALWTIARMGMPALRQAVAGGQYDFPKGIFYGGDRPSPVYQLLTDNFRRWLGEKRQVCHLDLHTGLGRSGTCKLLIDYPLDEAQRKKLTAWFGSDSFAESRLSGIAYDVRGGLGRWCVSSRLAEEFLYVCAEFGTFGPIQVLAGLRAENQAHHWGAPLDTSTQRASSRLRELFCPADESWRSQVVKRSLELVQQAIAGLSASR